MLAVAILLEHIEKETFARANPAAKIRATEVREVCILFQIRPTPCHKLSARSCALLRLMLTIFIPEIDSSSLTSKNPVTPV